MRIISDFRDFYDSVQGQGQDLDLQYLRRRKEVPLKGSFPTLPSYWHSGYFGTRARVNLDVADWVIGFCGKIYGVVRLSVPDPSIRYAEVTKVTTHCYNIEAVDAFLEKHFKSKELEQYYRPISHKAAGRTGETWPRRYTRNEFQRFFNYIEGSRDSHADKFMEHHCPSFVQKKPVGWKEKPKLLLNPCLKDFEFFRLFDHYQAFQEIQMFLGGMASPEKPIPPVSDADMVICKGFDPKYSFRKAPGKKLRKRKQH